MPPGKHLLKISYKIWKIQKNFCCCCLFLVFSNRNYLLTFKKKDQPPPPPKKKLKKKWKKQQENSCSEIPCKSMFLPTVSALTLHYCNKNSPISQYKIKSTFWLAGCQCLIYTICSKVTVHLHFYTFF